MTLPGKNDMSCGPAIVKARLDVLHESYTINPVGTVPQMGHTGESPQPFLTACVACLTASS